MNFKDFLGSDALQQASLGLLTGGNAQQQLALGATGFFNGRKEQKTRNATLEWLKTNAPELGGLMESGAISPGDAVSLAWKARQDAMKPQEPKNPFMSAGGQLYNWQTGEWVTPPGGGADTEYAKRQQAAQQFGLAPDSPGYQSFILTGKMPREDAQPLTATDKKAILEADDQVQTNRNAIDSLTAAAKINEKANSGFGAGARATLGNNLPDWLVPDQLSSPDSSAATAEYDNLVMGSALGQLKAIFGGNPTEGERAILLDLQASSSKPPAVRSAILARATEMAQRRLEFNQQRANDLRGGDYYKPQGGARQGTGRTSSGISFTVE